MRKYTREEIKKAIAATYKDQKELADKMNISESALSNKIKRCSDKFVRELEMQYGVNFNFIVKDTEQVLLERVEALQKRIEKLEQQNQAWQNYTATLLEEMEKQGTLNKQLRVEFYTLLKFSTEQQIEMKQINTKIE